MFRLLQKHGFSSGHMFEFGRCVYATGTLDFRGDTDFRAWILDLLRTGGHSEKIIIGFAHWVYQKRIAEDPELTLREALELTVNGFSNHIVPTLVRTFMKSECANDAIAAFYFLQILGVDKFEGGSKILLASAKNACSYALDDEQKEIAKSIIGVALEPAIKSFEECEAWEARALIDELSKS